MQRQSVVSRERLVDELLRDQTADTAAHTLRVQVSRLRKALAADGDPPRLIVSPPGYLLRVEVGELDLNAFEQRLSDGQRALELGDPGEAAAMLREAGSLWRGRPLADLEFEPFARFEVQRLEELRLLAVEERIEAELALGRHAALCPELEALVAEHPLRERLRGQLMLALYRGGRQANALGIYRAGRALLVEELALEPSRELRQLEQAILRQDAALQLPERGQRQAAATVLAAPRREATSEEPRSEAAHDVHPRRRLRRSALAVGVAGVIAALAIAPQLGGSAKRPGLLDANVIALISPGNGAVKATVPLQAPPTDLAAGFGSLWVAEADTGLVVRVDPQRRAVIALIPVGRRPSRIVTAAGRVWVLDTLDRTVSAIDPSTDAVAQTVAVGGDPRDLAVSAGSVWVADHRNGTVLRLDASTGHIQSVVRTGNGPRGLAVSGAAVWVANDESGTVARINVRTGLVTDTIRVGDAPAALAASAAGVWVLDRLDSTLSRIDPSRNAVRATVALAGAPAGLTFLDGSVWLEDQRHGTLSRLDPQHGDPRSTIRIGDHPRALAAAGGVWVAADAAGASHRGGTLTSFTLNTVIDTIDPAASNSPNVPSLQLSGLTNDGLVSLNHVAGPDGARLVPDLALALASPGHGGDTYMFRIRPAISFSTGVVVKPSDVKRSFERLFELGSSGASYYETILGARECSRAPGTCDLSPGIVADDRAGTITFRLSRPDPDFLYKLTLPYADVLPASTPGREARTPLPATGPYMIARYFPGRELRLVRNPRFREWSAAAQPDGYPDQIVIRLGLTGAQSAASIVHGQSDFMANNGTIPGNHAASFLLHHRSQVRINPFMLTNFLFLNVNAPPFDDLRVRRALNLALDRSRIVASDGGPVAAQPTCQILPPQLPGYRRYCPYTRDAQPDGLWHGPDLGRARRLIAASGTKGMKVTVWDAPAPQLGIIEGQATVAALKQLGYRASLRLLPDSTYFTYVNDSRNHAQIIDGGWSADYPSANDFIGKLTCNYFVPRNGPATTNASEFCDPAVDKQIARAASLQTTDPPAATALWTGLDRQLTDRAIWLPTITPNETDLISQRVGDYQYNPVWGTLIDQLWVR